MTTAENSETLDVICQRSYDKKTADSHTWSQFREDIIWRYVFILTALHIGLIAALSSYAFGLHSTPMKFRTILWTMVVAYLTGTGVTAGAHRLWSHRSYKANLPLRILLMILYSGMGLNPLYYWIRDHRIHHKYSETDADPHNAKRGFLFAHCGWLAMKRHPECIRRGKEVNMSDIIADPVVMFQKKYEIQLKLLVCFVVPTAIPVIFWKETILHAVLTQCLIRYVTLLNVTCCVNSVAHLWGSRPYNRFLNPADNLIVSLVTYGEGSHNYHHTFPWDHKTPELLPYINVNVTTLFIKAMAKLGWAYDLREPSAELVEKVVRRIGYKSGIQKAH